MGACPVSHRARIQGSEPGRRAASAASSRSRSTSLRSATSQSPPRPLLQQLARSASAYVGKVVSPLDELAGPPGNLLPLLGARWRGRDGGPRRARRRRAGCRASRSRRRRSARQPVDIGCEDRQLPGHRLEHGPRQRLDVGGADEQVRHPVPGGDVGGDRDQVDPVPSGEASMYSRSSRVSSSLRPPTIARWAGGGPGRSSRRPRARETCALRGSTVPTQTTSSASAGIPAARRASARSNSARAASMSRRRGRRGSSAGCRSGRRARTARGSRRPRRSAPRRHRARFGAEAHPGSRSSQISAGGKLSWIAHSAGMPSRLATSTPGKVVTVAVLTNIASNPRPSAQATSSSIRPAWALRPRRCSCWSRGTGCRARRAHRGAGRPSCSSRSRRPGRAAVSSRSRSSR